MIIKKPKVFLRWVFDLIRKLVWTFIFTDGLILTFLSGHIFADSAKI